MLYRDNERTVGIAREDRLRHVHVLGRTGVGKSTLLLNQIRGDTERGAGVCVIDPHGDLAEAVARSIPRHRTNDVIYFDPADDAFSVAFNPLACSDPARRDLVADDVLAAFEKVYDLTHTPRLKDTLRNALYVLVEKGMTRADIHEEDRRDFFLYIDELYCPPRRATSSRDPPAADTAICTCQKSQGGQSTG